MAGIGGFSGRESDVSVAWLAAEVKAGRIRWVLDQESSGAGATAGGAGLGAGRTVGAAGFAGRGLPGDGRAGSRVAIAAAAKACVAVTLPVALPVRPAARAVRLHLGDAV